MAEFNPAETRSGMDYLVALGTQHYESGGKEEGLWLMESVNQTWCSLTQGQKKQVKAVESPSTTFATGPDGKLGILEINNGQNFVPLTCSKDRNLKNEFVQGKFEVVPDKPTKTSQREETLKRVQDEMNMIMWGKLSRGEF